MGRAGRTAPGLCLRIFPEAEYESLSEFSAPEIMSADLASVVLVLSAWGCQSVDEMLSLPFIDAPPIDRLRRGLDALASLGAVAGATLTAFGQTIADMPLEPRLAAVVAKATDLPSALRVAALLDEDTAKGGNADLAKRPVDTKRLARRLGKDVDGPGDALGAAGRWIPIPTAAAATPPMAARCISGKRQDSALDADGPEYPVVADGDRRRRPVPNSPHATTDGSAGPTSRRLGGLAVPSQGRAVRARDVTAIGATELDSATAPQPEPEETGASHRDDPRPRRRPQGSEGRCRFFNATRELRGVAPPIFDARNAATREYRRRRSRPTWHLLNL